MIILVSFARDGAWTTQVLPPEYTWDNFRRLATDASLLRPIRNSVIMTLLATAGNVVVCSVAAYLLVFRRFPGRRLLGVLVALPWAIPPTAIAIGLASTFNRTDLSTARILLVGTSWILPLAYFISWHPAGRVGGGGFASPTRSVARGGRARVGRRLVADAAPRGLPGGPSRSGGRRDAGGQSPRSASSWPVKCCTHTRAVRSRSKSWQQVRAFAFGTAAAYSVVLIGIVLLITLLARAAEDGRRGVMALRS